MWNVSCLSSLLDEMEGELERLNSSSEKRYFPESLDSSDGDEEGSLACEDLELNPFDGLPYSSRYYKLLKEREDRSVVPRACRVTSNEAENQPHKTGEPTDLGGPGRGQSWQELVTTRPHLARSTWLQEI